MDCIIDFPFNESRCFFGKTRGESGTHGQETLANSSNILAKLLYNPVQFHQSGLLTCAGFPSKGCKSFL